MEIQRIIWLIYSLDIRLFFALQTQTEYDLHRHGVSPVSFCHSGLVFLLSFRACFFTVIPGLFFCCHSGLDPESRRLRNQY